MRYTTLIDISDNPVIYKNVNARLVYLHLVLVSGYHNDDRDLCALSIRNLAYAVGISVSATRHALHQLEQYKLITRQANMWLVKKFLLEEKISPRAKTKKQEEVRAEMTRNEQQTAQEREERRQREKLLESGKTQFMLYYEQKIQEAAAGDPDAQRIVDKRRAQYEQQCAEIKNQQK